MDEERPGLIYWQEGATCSGEGWEEAYSRFESPATEVRKFVWRYRKLGLLSWPKSGAVVELFCGRGNGLKALEQIGFESLEGVDLSRSLLAGYDGPARLYVGDCRHLKLPDRSRDIVVVQGGLHHLPCLPDDLKKVLREAHRILTEGGRIVIVEPWSTPFLRLAHAACRSAVLRRIWPKLDALAHMIEEERETYEAWLSQPSVVEEILDSLFVCEKKRVARGKLMYVGKKR